MFGGEVPFTRSGWSTLVSDGEMGLEPFPEHDRVLLTSGRAEDRGVNWNLHH